MLTTRLIPCLDVSHGRVVKGVKFQGLKDAGDPVELSLRYQDEGADELVLLDVSATVEGRRHQLQTVAKVRAELALPLTTGGGVKGAHDAEALLVAGADKVGVNTAAVARPELVSELSERFGAQCTVVAVDAKRRIPATPDEEPSWLVVVRAGTTDLEIDAVQWAKEVCDRGAGEILLTSWDRDGTREGYDLQLLDAVSRAVSVPVIASGGADTVEHLAEAIDSGGDAVLAASIFHHDGITVRSLKEQLAAKGYKVRL
jgi:cyclase